MDVLVVVASLDLKVPNDKKKVYFAACVRYKTILPLKLRVKKRCHLQGRLYPNHRGYDSSYSALLIHRMLIQNTRGHQLFSRHLVAG